MGNIISQLFTRLFDYPLKEKPFCVYREENVSSLDDELRGNIRTDYDKVTEKFNRKLMERRKEIYDNRKEDVLLKTFPLWNETTVSYLHSLYLMFCDKENKLIDYRSFECILECIGDESPQDSRQDRFSVADQDADGFINYYDYLYVIYNFHSPDVNTGLKRLSMKVAEKAMFVNNLSIDKQLEYGLF